jgi:hypothetical protein
MFSPNAAANGSKLVSSREFMNHWLVKLESSIPYGPIVFKFQKFLNY